MNKLDFLKSKLVLLPASPLVLDLSHTNARLLPLNAATGGVGPERLFDLPHAW
jgi:hypothetical protein